jgi:hypothetical protein
MLPPAPTCSGCGTSSGYGSYSGDMVGGEIYGGVVSGDYYNDNLGGTIVNPSMTNIAPAP